MLVAWFVLTALLVIRNEFLGRKRKRAEAIVRALVYFPVKWPSGDYTYIYILREVGKHRFTLCSWKEIGSGSYGYKILAQPYSDPSFPSQFQIMGGRMFEMTEG